MTLKVCRPCHLNGVKVGSFANDKTEGVMQMLLYDDLCRKRLLIQQIEEMGLSTPPVKRPGTRAEALLAQPGFGTTRLRQKDYADLTGRKVQRFTELNKEVKTAVGVNWSRGGRR